MTSPDNGNPPVGKPGTKELFLFWACFIALIATAFGFIVRTQIIDDWGNDFGLSDTRQGEILGVGLWPFAVSIVLFSLIIDWIGYGRAMIFAFVCHVASAIVTIATPMLAGDPESAGYSDRAYWVLYFGTFLLALGNGTVEAVINPVVATLFPNQKTKWLNILHAGWPGGLVLGGLLALYMGDDFTWQPKVALLFLPVVTYGAMMFFCHFPVNERVAAGVSYKGMLQQVGLLGALIVSVMIIFEVSRIFEQMGYLFVEGAPILGGLSEQTEFGLAGVVGLVFGGYTRSLGQPLFILLLLIMIPLATTELGTDSWITSLMESPMRAVGLQAGWVLVYTSLIMLVLRFFAGPIVHQFSPLGLLAISAAIAIVGLIFLSEAAGITILVAATIYGVGKSFFWPTMLGVSAEQFPKGGALTLNTMGGMGMLAVGVIGNPLLGNLQDRELDQRLAEQRPELHQQIMDEQQVSVFGPYRPIDQEELASLPEEEQSVISMFQDAAKKNALKTVAIFPTIMLVCYVGLILYFRARGGYKPKTLVSEQEEEAMVTGGVEGPADK